jgi:hypothetical protein
MLIGEPIEPRLVAEGRSFVARMLWFLKDRAELARLLLAGAGDEPGLWRRDDIVAARLSGAASGPGAGHHPCQSFGRR